MAKLIWESIRSEMPCKTAEEVAGEVIDIFERNIEMFRTKVPGGWFVAFPQYGSILFLSDPDHSWSLAADERGLALG